MHKDPITFIIETFKSYESERTSCGQSIRPLCEK